MLKTLSEDLKDFVRKCLTTDEKKRLSLKELSTHPLAIRLIDSYNPLILRRGVSSNENQDVVAPVQPESNGINKPKILHHRQNNGGSYSP